QVDEPDDAVALPDEPVGVVLPLEPEIREARRLEPSGEHVPERDGVTVRTRRVVPAVDRRARPRREAAAVPALLPGQIRALPAAAAAGLDAAPQRDVAGAPAVAAGERAERVGGDHGRAVRRVLREAGRARLRRVVGDLPEGARAARRGGHALARAEFAEPSGAGRGVALHLPEARAAARAQVEALGE